MEKDNILIANNYVNLYHMSIKILKKLLINKEENQIILVSNCISLIAGLSFYLLQNQYYKFCVLNDENYSSEFDIQLIISNDKKIINSKNINFFFNYIGEEKGILCLHASNPH